MPSSQKIAVYSANWCSDCTNLKNMLNDLGIPYEERDIQMIPSNATELKNQIGKEAVPYLRVEDHWLKGYGFDFSKEKLISWLSLYSNNDAIVELENISNKALAWIKEAGDYALEKIHTKKNIDFKAQKDFVTEVDHYVDKFFSEKISSTFSNHSIVSEEIEDRHGDSDFKWVIDPIDGTVNYSRGLPIWGVSIGITYKNQIVGSFISLPSNNEIYSAILGKGSYCNGQKISVSTTSSLEHCLISNGDYNVGPEEGIEKLNQNVNSSMASQATSVQRVKCFGSAVWEGAQVACGRLDAYAMEISHPWDVCATSLLVQEAGGIVTHKNGSPFVLDDLCNAVFTNGILHTEVLKVLK
jgi:myo-inositol-1(or 4)-monophosphatase